MAFYRRSKNVLAHHCTIIFLIALLCCFDLEKNACVAMRARFGEGQGASFIGFGDERDVGDEKAIENTDDFLSPPTDDDGQTEQSSAVEEKSSEEEDKQHNDKTKTFVKQRSVIHTYANRIEASKKPGEDKLHGTKHTVEKKAVLDEKQPEWRVLINENKEEPFVMDLKGGKSEEEKKEGSTNAAERQKSNEESTVATVSDAEQNGYGDEAGGVLEKDIPQESAVKEGITSGGESTSPHEIANEEVVPQATAIAEDKSEDAKFVPEKVGESDLSAPAPVVPKPVEKRFFADFLRSL